MAKGSRSSGAEPLGPTSIPELQEQLAEDLYFAGHDLATAIFLALRLGKPLFLEGEAGVGKTQVAKTLAHLLDAPLVRLQCYEGLDVSNAVYEWDYSRQMLHIRLLEARSKADDEQTIDLEQAGRGLFDRDFLLERPLLQAVTGSRPGHPLVLLIDELDRADEEFEAFLLEILSDFQITIPELGTLVAEVPPVVVLTSNRTREIHDALRRRCLYHWVDYPSFEKEVKIVRAKAPEAGKRLSREVTAFVQTLRREDLYKRPGVAETLDWVDALVALDQRALTPDNINDTLGVLLKYQDDVDQVRSAGVQSVLERSRLEH